MRRVRRSIFLGFLVCLVFTGCSTVHSGVKQEERKTLSTLLVYAQGVNVAKARTSFLNASKDLSREYHLTFEAIHEVYVKRPKLEESPAQKVYSWKRVISSALSEKYDVVYVLLPREDIFAADGGLVLGYAQGIGLIGKISNPLAYSIVTGNQKWDRQMVFHEMSHLLGVKHSNSGVMKGKEWSPTLAGTIEVSHDDSVETVPPTVPSFESYQATKKK